VHTGSAHGDSALHHPWFEIGLEDTYQPYDSDEMEDLQEEHKSGSEPEEEKVELPQFQEELVPEEELEVDKIERSEKNAALAIWMGTTIDAIPESLLIGMLATKSEMTIVFMFSVFLSNFPEALASSKVLLEAGMKKSHIFLLWTYVMILTGVGALAGACAFDLRSDLSPFQAAIVRLIEGISSGAMLVMISESVFPVCYLLFVFVLVSYFTCVFP